MTAKESKAFKKAVGRDHRTLLFHDRSLANKAIGDGGTKTLGQMSFSKRDIFPIKYEVSEGMMFKNLLEL